MMKGRENWIDALKGLCILAVIMPHCGLSGLPGKWGGLCGFGGMAIIPFFIISSYLSLVSYEKYRLRKDYSYWRWLKHKFTRLIPLYFLALIPAVIIGGFPYWLRDGSGISILNVCAHLSFTHGLFPYYNNSLLGVEWYVGVLAIWYAIVPIMAKYINTLSKTLVLLILSIFLVTIVCRYVVRFLVNSDSYVEMFYWQQFSFLPEIPILLMGQCLFYVKSFIDRLRKGKHRILSLTILLVTIILMFGQAFNKNHLYHVGDLYLCGAIFFGMVIFYYVGNYRGIDNSFLAWLGRISYPMYLFHNLLIRFYDIIIGSTLPESVMATKGWVVFKYFIIVFASMLLSQILIKYIEKPIVGLLERNTR